MDFRKLFRMLPVVIRRSNSSLGRTTSGRAARLISLIALTLWPSAQAWAWPTTARPAVWQDLSLVYSLLAGAGFLLFAVLLWMVWSRRFGRRVGRPLDGPTDHWGRLIQATKRATTFDGLLTSSLSVLTESFAADRGLVVKYSPRRGKMYPVDSVGLAEDELTNLIEPTTAATIFQTSISGGRTVVVAERSGNKKNTTTVDSNRYWLTIPIVKQYQVLAILAFSSRDIQPDNAELLKTATSIRDYLSQTATGFLATAVGEIRRDASFKADMLAKELAGCAGVEQALGKIVDVIRQLLPVDYISISRFDSKSENVIRWSAFVDGGKLIEKQYPILYGGTDTTGTLGKSLRPVIEDDLSANPQTQDSPEARRGMRSRMTIPILYGGKYLAGMTIAHRARGTYDDATLVKLESVSRVLGGWLQVKDTEIIATRLDRYLDVINRLDNLEDSRQGEIINMVRRAMNVSLLRLFRYDPQEKSLNLAASATARPMGEGNQSILPTPADRLPWHRFALHSRRACLIDQSDPERLMSSEESRLALVDRFKTGLLMPVFKNGETLGILSAAEMRHPARRRFEGADFIFMRSAATRMAGFLGGGNGRALPRVDRFLSRDFMPMLATPLTTIYGSVDLIRQNRNEMDTQTARYLGNIERAAERIKKAAIGRDRETRLEEPENKQLDLIEA